VYYLRSIATHDGSGNDMTDQMTQPPAALLIGAEQGDAVWIAGNRLRPIASGEQTAGAYGLMESLVRAGQGPPRHVHHAHDEAFLVLEGELRIVCGDAEHRAGPGDYALLPRGVPHTFAAVGDRDVRMLTLVSPGGGERFFLDAGVPASASGLPPVGPPDIPRMIAAGRAHDIEILGPPLAV
jgi:quercetin dioxygenase-like cupin family protein